MPSSAQRWTLEGAALVREGLLQQNALDPADSFCSAQKQCLLLRLFLDIYHEGQTSLEAGCTVQRLIDLPLLAQARRLKSQHNSEQLEGIRAFAETIHSAFDELDRAYVLEESLPS